MTKTAFIVAAVTSFLLYALPAHAQRVFVSGSGSDSNPCTFTQPCRTFAQAFTTAPTNGEIDVLDPAGYGPLTITHGISIQAHGFGGVTQASNADAIYINATTSDAITLNGLLIDGEGTGANGIHISSAGSVQILNCVIRHFSAYGIDFFPSPPINLLVSDTVASDNSAAGISVLSEVYPAALTATLNRVIANNNGAGVSVDNSQAVIVNSVISNNGTGLSVQDTTTVWLGKSTISGNGTGVSASGEFATTINSYGNNAINGNTTNVSGSLTPASTR
jgi:Periplasmic copper-binding protein (NosD)